MKIWVISMANADARRDAFRQRAGGTSLHWEFYDANTVLHPDLLYSPDIALREHGRPMQTGELGCYSSHFALWLKLLEGPDDHCLVFEDDVIIDWNFVEAFVRDGGSRRHDYIRLYYKRPVKAVSRAFPFVTRDCSLIELYGRAYGTQGYFLSRRGAERFVDACRVVERPVDDQMDRSWVHGVPNLALFPCPIMEENVSSTIGMQRFERDVTGSAGITRNLNRDRKAARRAYWRAATAEWLRIKRGHYARMFRARIGATNHGS